ncbi:MAG: hypothetical protein Q7J82_10185 [Coriobacteriia bacterium]|nr:hypothetical protein [Coriobacteriia bacterium]
MRTCRLRTVYDLSGIGVLESTVLLQAHGVDARLVPESRLLVMEDMRVTGRGDNGDVRVTGRNVERILKGKPMLLQLDASLECENSDDATAHRSELEARTAEAESVISWALPHVVREKLADSLYTRLDDDPPDTWSWFDMSRFSTSEYYEDPTQLIQRCESFEKSLDGLSDSHRDLVLTALRWWRYGWNLDSAADETVAFWISIESSSCVVSGATSARQRALDALATAFPELASQNEGRRIRDMRDVLYNARCATVHSGRREYSVRGSIFTLAEAAASACIRLAVDGHSTATPTDQLLDSFGI